MKILKVGMLLTAMLSVFSQSLVVSAEAEDFSNYEEVNEFLYIHPDVMANETDLTSIPYYSYGEITSDEIVKGMEAYYDQVANYSEEEGRAPYYQFEKSKEYFQVEQFEHPALKADLTFFNSYITLANPYSGLTNRLLHFYSWYEDTLKMTNQELGFLSFAEAEQKVRDLTSQVFGLDDIRIEIRSLTKDELQEHVDYENLTPIKETSEPFTDEVYEVYFGEFTPYLNDYPVASSNGSGMSENIVLLGGQFALTHQGFEHFQLAHIPIGHMLDTYSEAVSYEEVLEIVSQTYTYTDEEIFAKYPTVSYIQDASIVYMPLYQESLDISAYFPVWQFSIVTDDEPTLAQRRYVNPIDGTIIY